MILRTANRVRRHDASVFLRTAMEPTGFRLGARQASAKRRVNHSQQHLIRLLPIYVSREQASMEKPIRFLNIGPETMDNANLIWSRVDARASGIVEDFHTSACKASVDISLSDQAFEHVKMAQTRYWRELLIAQFSKRYFNKASLVGIAHREIGFDVQRYIAGCTKITIGFLRLILGAELLLAQKAKLTSVLEKCILLEMSVAVLSYTSWLIGDHDEECSIDPYRDCVASIASEVRNQT